MLLNIIFTFSLIILAIGYIKIAEKFNIVDKPNHRSSHVVTTIRGGGVLFYFALVIYFFLTGMTAPYMFLGISLIAVVSYIDDLITLSSTFRLLIQFISISLILYQLEQMIPIDWPFLLLFLVGGIGFINFFNFMDGINGITGIYSITAIIGFYIINLESKIVDSTLLIFVCLSLIVFGYFNFRKKARFFAGDIGSITIACFFFYLTVLFYLNLEAPVVFLLFLVYMSDAVFTLLYRKKIGENITQPHRHHLYQKFTDIKKWPHLKTAIIYSSIQLVLNILVYMTYNFSIIEQWGIVFVCIVFSFVYYIYLFNILKKLKSN